MQLPVIRTYWTSYISYMCYLCFTILFSSWLVQSSTSLHARQIFTLVEVQVRLKRYIHWTADDQKLLLSILVILGRPRERTHFSISNFFCQNLPSQMRFVQPSSVFCWSNTINVPCCPIVIKWWHTFLSSCLLLEPRQTVDSDKLFNLSWNTSLHRTGWLDHDDAAIIMGKNFPFSVESSSRAWFG